PTPPLTPPPLFPYTTLFRSLRVPAQTLIPRRELLLLRVELPSPGLDSSEQRVQLPLGFRHGPLGDLQHVTRDPETPRDGESVRPDRKSTRLNSSHLVISYAV